MTYLQGILTASLLIFSLFSGPASAEVPVDKTGAPVSIAVLDWRAALLGTEQAKMEFRSIRESLRQDEEEIRVLAESAKQLQAKLKADGTALNADEKRQLSKEIQEKAEEYQFLGQRLQKETRQRQEAYVRTARPLLDEAVRQVIKELKLDLLVDRQAVTYMAPRLDITADVIRQLNAMQAVSK